MTYLAPYRPPRPAADPLLADILRDLSRGPPCDCRRCREAYGFEEDDGFDEDDEGALGALGALASVGRGLGRIGAAAGKASSAARSLGRVGSAAGRLGGLGRALGRSGAAAGRVGGRARIVWQHLSPAQLGKARAAQRALGWKGWTRPAAGTKAPTMALLKAFARGRPVSRGTSPGQLTPAALRRLRLPQFRALKPLFAPLRPGRRAIYDIHPRGQRNSDYVGVANKPAGFRLLEHLLNPDDDIYSRLNGANAPDLDDEVIRVGSTAGQGNRAHIVEALWQQQLEPRWIHPNHHGFDA